MNTTLKDRIKSLGVNESLPQNTTRPDAHIARNKSRKIARTIDTFATAATPDRKPEIAYVIKDKLFGEFQVIASANAWWLDRTKVEAVITAFKYRANKLQASVAGGISNYSLDYFIETHPEFSNVIEGCRSISALKAKQTMVQALDKDLTTVRWFLETTEPGEYGKKQPLVGVQINMHQNVDTDRASYT